MEDFSELSLLLEWIRARDVFLGLNHQQRDFALGFALASRCEHPDAKWLVGLISRNGLPVDVFGAKSMFETDLDRPMARCFAALMVFLYDHSQLIIAAKLGCALAQAKMAAISNIYSFHFAEQAASQLEPEGLYQLGYLYNQGKSVAMNKTRSHELFLQAAQLGYVDAYQAYARSFKSSKPEYFFWLGKFCVCAQGYMRGEGVINFMAEAVKRIREFVRDPELRCTVYQIGASLRGHVQQRHVFGLSESEVACEAAARAVDMHEIWCKKTRVCVDYWTVIGLRNGVCKDIRLLIARLIWNTRAEALHLNERMFDETRFFDRKLMKLHGLL